MHSQKLACFLTGVPIGIERTLPTLARLLSNYNVSYYAVMREEFASKEVTAALKGLLQNVTIIIVPLPATQAICRLNTQVPILPTVLQMWHEIGYGCDSLENIHEFDLIFRTRFDARFIPQFLPDIQPEPHAVYVPEQLAWSGTNDMICLASPTAFRSYASTIKHMLGAPSGVPEQILSYCLTQEKLMERRLEVWFSLFRPAVHSGLSDATLDLIAYNYPELSCYRVGTSHDTADARDNYAKQLRELTLGDSLYPLFPAYLDTGGYACEIDSRDGKPFRFIGSHFHLRRPMKNERVMTFWIHYMPSDWNISMLSIFVDNYPVDLSVCETDSFGRVLIQASFPGGLKFRRPLSKICIFSQGARVPSEIDPSSGDHRMLSVAIGIPHFY
jgi:hypothetical protein